MPPSNLPVLSPASALLAAKLAELPILDPDTIDERTLAQTLSATSAEDVGAMPETASLDSITGEPFYLLGIEGCLPSGIKGREDEFYYLLRCRYDDGRQFTASTGSKFCITRAIRWTELEALPRRVMSVLLESKRDSTRSSLWLVDAPLRTAPTASAPLEAKASPRGFVPVPNDDEPF